MPNLLDFLLSEAPAAVPDEVDNTATDTPTDTGDTAATDNKDAADTSEDTPSVDTSEDTPEDAEAPPEDETASKASGAIVKLTKKLNVEDTNANRAFLIERFEELREAYQSLIQFIDNMYKKYADDTKSAQILDRLTNKASYNLKMIDDGFKEQTYLELDIKSIYSMYKMHYSDANAIHSLLKTIVRSSKSEEKKP